VPIAKARDLKFQIDWKLKENAPVKPKMLGTKVLKEIPLDQTLLDAIDWNPFFQVCTCRRTVLLH